MNKASIQGFRRPRLLPFILAIMLIASSVAIAFGSMASPNYRQPISVMGGGSSAATSAGYVNNGTLGQSSPIGISQVAGSQINNAGFWTAAPFDLNIVGPDVTIDSTDPSTTPTNVTPMSITFSSSDTTATFECKWDSGEFTPCSSPIGQSGFDEGPHTFAVRALNALVPGTQATYAWDIDITNPTLSPVTIATNNASGIWAKAGDSITLSITASENITAPTVTIASQSAIVSGSTVSWSASYTVQAGDMPGAATFSVSSYSDLAGNAGLTVTATTDLSTVSIDTTSPDTSIDSSPLSLSTSTTGSFTFSGSDVGSGVASYQCQLDSTGFSPCTSPQNLSSLSQDSHTFEVRATDLVGNTDPTPATYTWTVDTTGPNAPAVTGTTPTFDTRPTWHWSTGGGGGNGTFRYQMNSELGAWTETGSTSHTPISPLSAGSYTLYVQERDTAGNWSASGSKLVQIDTSTSAAWTYNEGSGIWETCVNNPGQLQSSLSDAETDGRHNLIKVVQNSYVGLFTYAGDEDYDLTLQGGYNADCSVRTINPTLTTLDGDTDLTPDGIGNGVTLDMAMLNANSAGSITVDGFTVINGNNGYDDGGCIRIYTDAGQTTVSGNIVHICRAINGGGIGVETVSGRALITNNIVHHNSATLTGGGIYSVTSTGEIVILNNTVADNQATDATNGTGGGIAVSINSDTGTADIINNIIRSNIVTPGTCEDVSIQSDGDGNTTHAVVTFHHNDTDTTNGVCSADGVFTVDPTNIDVDPQYVNQPAGDYHIQSTSPCKNTGDITDPDLPATDVDGQTRIFNSIVDMGADEVVVPPTTPSGLTATAVNPIRIDLSWTDNSTSEDAVEVQRTVGNCSSVNFATIASLSFDTVAYQDHGVNPGLKYSYRVRAANTLGSSGWSNCVSVTGLPLEGPTDLNVTGKTALSISLAWTDNSSVETQFTLQRKAGAICDNNGWNTAAGPAANATTFTNTGLTANTTYTYRIRANFNGFSSAWSNCAATETTLPASADPGGMTASAISAASISLGWTDNATDETGYQIQWKTGSTCDNSGWALLSNVAANTQVFQLNNRPANATYIFRVGAARGAVYSGWSGCASTTTFATATVAPAAPSGIAATPAVPAGQVVISWTDNQADLLASAETLFIIQRKAGAVCDGIGWAGVTNTATNVTSYTNTGLITGSTYSWRVRAANGAGSSAWNACATAVAP